MLGKAAVECKVMDSMDMLCSASPFLHTCICYIYVLLYMQKVVGQKQGIRKINAIKGKRNKKR